MSKSCIIIAGPTAVGKTSIALAIARKFSTEIISADSRQCFKELNIGVAKPSPVELEDIHHYFINSHSIQEDISAADFESYALNAIGNIFSNSDIAVMVGGTGLYIRAFAEGMDEIPPVDPGVRKQVISNYKQNGIGWLREKLEEADPAYLEKGESANPQRMMRALEVKLSTGNSIHSLQTGNKKKRDFNIVKIGLELPREVLYGQINSRVDTMMEAGLLEEARNLYPHKQLNALQTVGYRELFDHLDGKHSLERAVELIKQHTRHYAKRQMTWFKRDGEIVWMAPEEGVVLEYLRDL